MSNNLGLTTVAQNGTNKEAVVNTNFGQFDAVLTEALTFDLAASSLTVTTPQFQNAVCYITANAPASRTLTFPAVKRIFVVRNTSSNAVGIVIGTTTISLAAATAGLFYADGTANGLVQVAAGSGGGGGGSSVGSTLALTRLRRAAAAQSIANATWVNVTWDTVAEDVVGAYSGANPTRITVPAGYTKIRLTAVISWANNSTGNRYASIVKNGTTSVSFGSQTAVNEAGQNIETEWLDVAAGDYFELQVNQTSGGALNLTGVPSVFPPSTTLMAEWGFQANTHRNGRLLTPKLTDFSTSIAYNSAAGTANVDAKHGLNLTMTATAAAQMVLGRFKSAPTSKNAIARCRLQWPSQAGFAAFGLALLNSANKVEFLAENATNSATAWDSSRAYQGYRIDNAGGAATPVFFAGERTMFPWIRVDWSDNVSAKWYGSVDGNNWVLLWTSTLSAYLTAAAATITGVGLVLYAFNGGSWLSGAQPQGTCEYFEDGSAGYTYL